MDDQRTPNELGTAQVESSDESPPSAVGVLSVVCVVVAVQAIAGAAILWLTPDLQGAGQFGDLFGAVNTLFSGLAFAGLIYTALLQRSELSLQRKELSLTRTELSRTARAQEQAEIALRAQADAARQSAHLTAINFLLEHYQTERRKISGAYTAGSTQEVRQSELIRREQILSSMLDSLFDEVTKPSGEHR